MCLRFLGRCLAVEGDRTVLGQGCQPLGGVWVWGLRPLPWRVPTLSSHLGLTLASVGRESCFSRQRYTSLSLVPHVLSPAVCRDRLQQWLFSWEIGNKRGSVSDLTNTVLREWGASDPTRMDLSTLSLLKKGYHSQTEKGKYSMISLTYIWNIPSIDVMEKPQGNFWPPQ